MSIHGSISLMLFKLQKTEEGDFFELFKKSVKAMFITGVLEFYSEYIIFTNSPCDVSYP